MKIFLDGVREVEGRIAGRAGRGRALLEASRLRCQKGGEVHDAMTCLECERFVNYKPSHNGYSITIRCQWKLDDPVADLMTLPEALVSVEPDTLVPDAVERAVCHGVHHLLVARRDHLRGIVCRCDLTAPPTDGETVGDRMSAEVWALPLSATIADAADVMIERAVGCIPIVDDGVLRGIVTRTDLRRAGFEDGILDAHVCEPCSG